MIYVVLHAGANRKAGGLGLKYLEITGGVPLHGQIAVQGSKNAVLPILAACLLGDGICVLENCPVISDVRDTLAIMERLGCEVRWKEDIVQIDASNIKKYEINGAEAARIRSSVLFLGALLGKMGKAILPLPGGCAIGARPIDQHICVMECLGAEISIGTQIKAEGQNLCGAHIKLKFPSVGATENAILAAVMAEGRTTIENAAKEPEIEELCRFLNLRGARIVYGVDGFIRIRGVRLLGSVVYRMRADRIVTGTYLLAAAATGGSICVENYPEGQLDALLDVLKQMGTEISCTGQELTLASKGSLRAVPCIETAPYPGFPTDLQSPVMAVLCRAGGRSCICERIFENRFQIAGELCKMGACISVCGCAAVIESRDTLRGCFLCAPDLRGGAALVIAALQAQGKSVISGMEYVERGYENIVRDFRLLGAKIEQN